MGVSACVCWVGVRGYWVYNGVAVVVGVRFLGKLFRVDTLGGGAISSVGMGNRGILMHYSFGIPLGGNIVASRGHVGTTLPAVRGLVGSNNGIVLYSRLNGPGNRPGPRLSLTPITGTLSRGLNGRIIFTTSSGIMNRGTGTTIRTVGSNSIILLRGAHCHTRRAGGNRTFSTRLNSLTSVFMGSTFNATRHTRYSAINIMSRIGRTITNCLVNGRLGCLNGTIRSPTHPFIYVLNNTGISDGLPIVRGLLAGTSALVVNNNVTCAFLTSGNCNMNGSLISRAGVSCYNRVLGGTTRGNIGVLLPISYAIVGSFPGPVSTPISMAVISTSGVPSSVRTYSVNPGATRLCTGRIGGTGAII